ncbi:mitochondrial ribosomal small subunit component [Geranomyces michiganensis]|nr:mitochondrial ribosomal small subunit component [Geranomyces michiganensis]
MAPPLRNNPYALCKNIDRLRDAAPRSSRAALPPWYRAVRQYPPAVFTPKGVDPVHTGLFHPTPPSSPSSLATTSTTFTSTTAATARELYKRSDPRTYKARYIIRPPPITYPEDEIRAAFYKWHPLELSKPRTLVEDEQTLKWRSWEDIHGGKHADGTASYVPVTGESVVKHTLYLMSRKENPLSRHEAYQTALRAFYEARAKADHLRIEKRAKAIAAAQQVAEEEENQRALEEAQKHALQGDDLTSEYLEESAAGHDYGSMPLTEEDKKREKKDAEYWRARPLSARFVEWETAELEDSSAFEDEMRTARTLQDEMRRKMEQYEKRNIVDEAEPASDASF